MNPLGHYVSENIRGQSQAGAAQRL